MLLPVCAFRDDKMASIRGGGTATDHLGNALLPTGLRQAPIALSTRQAPW